MVLKSTQSVTASFTLLTIVCHVLPARSASTNFIPPACISGSQLLTNRIAHCANRHFDFYISRHKLLIIMQSGEFGRCIMQFFDFGCPVKESEDDFLLEHITKRQICLILTMSFLGTLSLLPGAWRCKVT